MSHANVAIKPMSMSSKARERIAQALSRYPGAGAGAAQIGDATVAILREFESALAPVVGKRGVAALYTRSVHLTTSAHPWLPGAEEDPLAAMDLALFQDAMSRQSSTAAAAAAAALLQTFRDLLASLVGTSLAGRLLHSAAPCSPPSRLALRGSRR